MHYHLEIILPPVENVEAAVEQILKPFCENGEDEDGHRNSHAFWDWYVIGGRWAGAKLEAMLDPKKLEEFNEELAALKVTVSGLQAGKQTLQPADQIPMVDALWNEFFPVSPIKICPLFSHFNDQYKNSDGYPDILRLRDMPKSLAADHVIIAGPSWLDDSSLEAEYMLQTSIWNGVNHAKAKWDGNVQKAIEERQEQLKNAKPDHAAVHMPMDDWLVVTVDYHS